MFYFLCVMCAMGYVACPGVLSLTQVLAMTLQALKTKHGVSTASEARTQVYTLTHYRQEDISSACESPVTAKECNQQIAIILCICSVEPRDVVWQDRDVNIIPTI